MRAWADSAGDHHARVRGGIRAVLDGSTPALLPHTVMEGWLLETSIAVTAGERPAFRHGLQTGLALAELLDALRPFTEAGPFTLGRWSACTDASGGSCAGLGSVGARRRGGRLSRERRLWSSTATGCW